MTSTDLQEIADTVVRRAQRQGFILPREIREELAQAGAPHNMWKDVLALARPSLSYRKGRYYYVPAITDRVRQEQDHQKLIRQAVEELISHYQTATGRIERREQNRFDFVQLVKAQAEDGRQFTLLSRDLSASGIRLIGTRSLLGQKIRIRIPRTDGSGPWCFLVRILWTCAVGDDLFENGGLFIEAHPDAPVGQN
jgi:hypothetical protein